jgi:hypothetical protein
MSGTSNRHRTSPDAVRALRAYLTKHAIAEIDLPHLVRKLDEAGFCIVAKYGDLKPPAGRGNEAFKKVKEDRRIAQVARERVARRGVYTGPDLIGKSHTSNLLKGGLT